MAEHEAAYLRECLKKKICPACQKSIARVVGTGQFKDGGFCSVDCYRKWNAALLIRRHKERLKKARLSKGQRKKRSTDE